MTMHLRYTDSQGAEKTVELGTDPVVIGRVPECNVTLPDDRVSRRHCEIRFWDDAYIIKDLRSHNGTMVNGKPIEIAILKPGDKIGVGGVIIDAESEKTGDGKAYRSILSEIVKDIEQKPAGTA